MTPSVTKVRSVQEIALVSDMVWEFFDLLRLRYPDMHTVIDDYLAQQDVAGELARFDEVFLPPAGECFLACLGEHPVGIVMLKPHGTNDCEMNRMFVRDRARGKGVGRLLAQALIDEARLRGYGTIWLDAFYRNKEALTLYESFGFVRFTDPDAFGGDDDRIVHMKLAL